MSGMVETAEMREEARKEREREAARRFRRKRKEAWEQLQSETDDLQAKLDAALKENEALKMKVQMLENAKNQCLGEDQGALEQARVKAVDDLRALFSGLGLNSQASPKWEEAEIAAEEKVHQVKRKEGMLMRRYIIEFQRALLPAAHMEVKLRVLRGMANVGDLVAEAAVSDLEQTLKLTDDQRSAIRQYVAEQMSKMDAILPRLQALREMILELESIRPAMEKNLCLLFSQQDQFFRSNFTSQQRAAVLVWTETNMPKLVTRLLGDPTAEFLELLPKQREMAKLAMCSVPCGAPPNLAAMSSAVLAPGVSIPTPSPYPGISFAPCLASAAPPATSGPIPGATPAIATAAAVAASRVPTRRASRPTPGASPAPAPAPVSAPAPAPRLALPAPAPAVKAEAGRPAAAPAPSGTGGAVDLESLQNLIRDAVARELARQMSPAASPPPADPPRGSASSSSGSTEAGSPAAPLIGQLDPLSPLAPSVVRAVAPAAAPAAPPPPTAGLYNMTLDASMLSAGSPIHSADLSPVGAPATAAAGPAPVSLGEADVALPDFDIDLGLVDDSHDIDAYFVPSPPQVSVPSPRSLGSLGIRP